MRPRPRPQKQLLTQKSIAMTEDQYRQLTEYVKLDRYRSVSELIREAIEIWLTERKEWEKRWSDAMRMDLSVQKLNAAR